MKKIHSGAKNQAHGEQNRSSLITKIEKKEREVQKNKTLMKKNTILVVVCFICQLLSHFTHIN